jgi:hypothetical protein
MMEIFLPPVSFFFGPRDVLYISFEVVVVDGSFAIRNRAARRKCPQKPEAAVPDPAIVSVRLATAAENEAAASGATGGGRESGV